MQTVVVRQTRRIVGRDRMEVGGLGCGKERGVGFWEAGREVGCEGPRSMSRTTHTTISVSFSRETGTFSLYSPS
jgi:hypothetical protein